MLAVASVAAVLGTAAPAQTAGAAIGALAPTTKWQLDYQPTHCVAARDFGPADNSTTLAIRPAPNGDTYELMIVRNGRGPKFAEQLAGTVDFGSGPVKSWVLRISANSPNKVLHMARVSNAVMAQARTAKSLRFQAGKAVDATMQLASMPALLTGLQNCTADLMKHWNHGGEADGRIAETAKGDMRPLFTGEDFPLEALQLRQEGSGQFLLLIDEQGKVAGCHLVKTSGIPAFDARACQVIRERAKFKPARDATGKAVRSSVTTPPIMWRLL